MSDINKLLDFLFDADFDDWYHYLESAELRWRRSNDATGN